jgi:predicted phosphodiesterase
MAMCNNERAPKPVKKQLEKTWEVSAFDRENGEFVTKTNHSYSHINEGVNIADLLVSQAAPTKVTPSKRVKPETLAGTSGSFLMGGDAQVPFHDPYSMDLFKTVNAEKRPDHVILLGDMLDLPSMSRYQQRPEWVQTTQASLDYLHTFLAQLRSDNPEASITMIHGNHEQRFLNYIVNNAQEALGLRRANAGKEMAVLSIQYLLRYEELGVNYVDGYPNGIHWLNESGSVKAIHGTNSAKGGSNAAKYLREERETTFYGHSHRLEYAERTFNSRLGAVTVAACSPGALCLTDGSVPGFHHTMNAEGINVKKAEDWQKGLVYGYLDNDEVPDISLGKIKPNGVVLEGKRYTA